MNRIILIGNGFDLAHGLKTSYANFIDWYWEKKILELRDERSDLLDDGLIKFKLLKYHSWSVFFIDNFGNKSISKDKFLEIIKNNPDHFEIRYSSFFSNILHQYETKGWVDIEYEYYNFLKTNRIKPEDLNKELDIIKGKLAEYLKEIKGNGFQQIERLKEIFFSPIDYNDISVDSKNKITEVLKNRLNAKDKYKYPDNYWDDLLSSYGIDPSETKCLIKHFKPNYLLYIDFDKIKCMNLPNLFLPDNIMILNFNYTDVADTYFSGKPGRFVVNHIHGSLDNTESIIFGYGDEKDETFKELQERNDKESLKNIKSIKYLEAPNYRKLLAFIESAPYQIYLMGHSCGQSDGTLLNTLFEHKNCISIKPFYYKNGDTDNYMEIVQNISRNFTDMKLMRDRVVNKTQCEPMPQAE